MIRLVQSADAGKAKIVGLADRWATWIVVIAPLCRGPHLDIHRQDHPGGHHSRRVLPLRAGARNAHRDHGGHRKCHKARLPGPGRGRP